MGWPFWSSCIRPGLRADEHPCVRLRPGGGKGLPRKNLLPIAGLPLLAHGILMAAALEEVGESSCPVRTVKTQP